MLRIKADPAPPAKPLTIVVADDVEEIQRLIATWLGEAGHLVTCAGSGRELVRLVREQAFDLIVTDIVMPDGDGHDAILTVNRIRPSARILAISGGGQKMPADAGLRIAKGVGADAVLAKPFTRTELLEAVAKIAAR